MTKIYFKDKTLTQQHNKKECDINNIMAKYQKTGVIDHINEYGEQYHDCDSTTYHEAMNIVANANSMFEELPSKARAKFNNDPASFLDYVQDPKNQDSLVEMGLANAPSGNEAENPAPKPKEPDKQKTEDTSE